MKTYFHPDRIHGFLRTEIFKRRIGLQHIHPFCEIYFYLPSIVKNHFGEFPLLNSRLFPARQIDHIGRGVILSDRHMIRSVNRHTFNPGIFCNLCVKLQRNLLSLLGVKILRGRCENHLIILLISCFFHQQSQIRDRQRTVIVHICGAVLFLWQQFQFYQMLFQHDDIGIINHAISIQLSLYTHSINTAQNYKAA